MYIRSNLNLNSKCTSGYWVKPKDRIGSKFAVPGSPTTTNY